MGGGGRDWQDVEEERRREALSHRCLTIEERIANCHDVDQLKSIAKLAAERIVEVRQRLSAKKEQEQRRLRYEAELEATAHALRLKYGIAERP